MTPAKARALHDVGLRRAMHKTINRVTTDLDRLHFNTVISALMEYINYLQDARSQDISAAAWKEATEALVLMLAPAAPHIAEELWQRTGPPVQRPPAELAGVQPGSHRRRPDHADRPGRRQGA